MATVPTELPSASAGLGRVVQPLADRRTWGGALHVLLGLPLGIAYFAFYLAGFATGAALAVVVVGVPLLFAVLASTRPLAAFEARLARSLTGVAVADPAPMPVTTGWSRRLRALLRDDATWRRLAYLLSRFPLGVAAFAAAAVIIGVPLALLAAPALYASAPVDLLVWRLDTLAEALVAAPLGLLLGLRATCGLRLLGRVSGGYARAMLG